MRHIWGRDYRLDDPVTFTTGATAATSIGNIVLKGKDTSEVNMGTWCGPLLETLPGGFI